MKGFGMKVENQCLQLNNQGGSLSFFSSNFMSNASSWMPVGGKKWGIEWPPAWWWHEFVLFYQRWMFFTAPGSLFCGILLSYIVDWVFFFFFPSIKAKFFISLVGYIYIANSTFADFWMYAPGRAVVVTWQLEET